MTESYTPRSSETGGVSGVTAELKDQAKTIGKDLKEKAVELTDNVAQAAKSHMSEMGTAAKEMAAGATDKVQSALNDQKSAGADYLGTIAGAVQRAAGAFESDVPQAAQYIRKTAGQIETVANAVRQRDMRELVGEVQQFARRQPTLFFGGALIIGFAALRFLKSSSPGTPGHASGQSANGNSPREGQRGHGSSSFAKASSSPSGQQSSSRSN